MFVQDDISLVPERLRLVVGAKVEHNDYSGVEVQPSARLGWTLNPSNTVIVSATRAVRTPSRVETDYTTTSLAGTAPLPTFVRLLPNSDFVAEELVAYELGYRARPMDTFYLTVSGFYNRMDNLLSTDLLTSFVEAAPPPARLILPVTFANTLEGSSYGFEATGDWRPTTWWRWTANYSNLRVVASRKPESNDVTQENRNERGSPRHQLQLQSSVDLPSGIEFDWVFRYVSELPLGASPAPAYTTSDVRVGWWAMPQLSIALVGQDLHAERHLEWFGGNVETLRFQRRAYVNITWRP